jgi:hypothetical protein
MIMKKILRIDVMVLNDQAERSTLYFSSIEELTNWLYEELDRIDGENSLKSSGYRHSTHLLLSDSS